MTTFMVHDFATAAQSVLAFLHERFGFGLWMITRVEGDDWIVLQSDDHGYSVPPGTVFRWADSFCYEMVRGNGPHIAPDSNVVPAYAAAPIGRQVPIQAYIGVPLRQADGVLFGTLCAIDPTPQPAAIAAEEPLIELLAALLSTLLQTELDAAEVTRQKERLAVEAHIDALTQLYNRRGWDKLLAQEEARCQRYGNPAAILAIDLDGLKETNDTIGHAAGDALLVRAATALRGVTRGTDIVARLGGDEFGVLAVECDQRGSEVLVERVRLALAAAQVPASLGLAMRVPSLGLQGAWEAADQQLYVEKRAHHQVSAAHDGSDHEPASTAEG